MTSKLKILVVDDDQNMAHTLSDILSISGYDPIEAHSPEAALAIINERKIDCVLTDVRMPGMSGVELFEEIHKIKENLPVVLMSAYARNEEIKQGLKQGAIGLLTKPLEISQLLRLLSILSNERCIAIIDDDPVFCKTLEEILTRRGFTVCYVNDPKRIGEVISQKVQCVLLDMKLKGISGQEVLGKIRRDYEDIPVLLITSYRDEMAEAIETALAMEAIACLYKPLDIPKLIQKLEEILVDQMKKEIQKKPDHF